jgi:hypothetical protein
MACMEESLFAGHILFRSEPVSHRQAYKGAKSKEMCHDLEQEAVIFAQQR